MGQQQLETSDFHTQYQYHRTWTEEVMEALKEVKVLIARFPEDTVIAEM